jgi:hypothetical protein
LIALADVDPSRKEEARRWLRWYLLPVIIKLDPRRTISKSRMRSLYDAAEQGGGISKRNAALDLIEKAARELDEALFRLRDTPRAHSDFWMAEVFGPIIGNEFERHEVAAVPAKMWTACREARVVSKGGQPKKLGLQRIVDYSARFYDRFCTTKISERGPFRDFTIAFADAAAGIKIDEHDVSDALVRQIRSVIRARRHRNNTASNLGR